MIKRIQFEKNVKKKNTNKVLFGKNDSIVFSRFNCIVGPQNSSKSYLLSCIKKAIVLFNNSWTKTHVEQDVTCEIILPQDKSRQKYRYLSFVDESKNEAFNKKFPDLSLSQGNIENVIHLLKKTSETSPDGAVVLLDEPDVSISTEEAILISNYLARKAVDNNCQIILTANNPIFISLFKEVYDITTNTWVSSKKYLERQAFGRAGKILDSIQNSGLLV